MTRSQAVSLLQTLCIIISAVLIGSEYGIKIGVAIALLGWAMSPIIYER
jgi:hypothetical protein